jgi:hypothetical protein
VSDSGESKNGIGIAHFFLCFQSHNRNWLWSVFCELRAAFWLSTRPLALRIGSESWHTYLANWKLPHQRLLSPS